MFLFGFRKYLIFYLFMCNILIDTFFLFGSIYCQTLLTLNGLDIILLFENDKLFLQALKYMKHRFEYWV